MSADAGKANYVGLLTALVLCALLLLTRVVYLYLSNGQRFPIDTVKIVASFQHITRQELESVLTKYLQSSFVMFPIEQLQKDLMGLSWTDQVEIERIWPGTLKIVLNEKKPVAVWNDALLTLNGQVFSVGESQATLAFPQLVGPVEQKNDVLQMYQKLSKILAKYGLEVKTLKLCDNQAWELSLTNGVELQLGKHNLVDRLQRFCRSYPVVFSDRVGQLAHVDLRYARGMAVQWKQQTGR